MQEIKKVKNQIMLDLIMVLVSIFMTFDYSYLIMSGDDSTRRKIVAAVWAIAIIGWSIRLFFDLRKRKA